MSPYPPSFSSPLPQTEQNMKEEQEPYQYERKPLVAPRLAGLERWPWWLLAAVALGLYLFYTIITDTRSTAAFWFVLGQRPEELTAGNIALRGMLLTIYVAAMAYLLSLVIGTVVGLGRVSKNPIAYNLATFYVEIIRGIPILVLLFYFAFVIVPMLISAINGFGDSLIDLGLTRLGERFASMTTRDFSNTWRVIIGLGAAYGAFMAETVRAGIESVERGQIEAAQALGLTKFQTMRFIVLPQAFRRVLPILGNDLVAIVKDSSLVSVLGVQEMTQLAKLHSSSTFLFFQTYSILAFLYLILTVMLTRFVRWLERKLARGNTIAGQHV